MNGIQEVSGSIPLISTRKNQTDRLGFFSYIRLRRVILAAPAILRCSDIGLRPVSEANIISLRLKGAISLRSNIISHLAISTQLPYNGKGWRIISDSVLRVKSKEFAKRIVFVCKDIKIAHAPSPLINQLLRSGTSVGANIHEAQYAQGKADFISKLEIALKEASETEYWLELLYETGYLSKEIYKSTQQECGSIRRMLISSCKTVKEKI